MKHVQATVAQWLSALLSGVLRHDRQRLWVRIPSVVTYVNLFPYPIDGAFSNRTFGNGLTSDFPQLLQFPKVESTAEYEKEA